MEKSDLERLRRFSLTVALIILTYSLAGIVPKTQPDISLIGLKFTVSRVNWLPIGLVIASIYATIRFYYYGFMLNRSPYGVRRDALDHMYCDEPEYTIHEKKVPIYWGPTRFTAHICSTDREEAEEYVKNFPQIFPRFAGGKPSMNIISFPVATQPPKGEAYEATAYEVKVLIPIRCKAAALIQDFDYSASVWLNLGALALFFLRLKIPNIFT